MPNFYIQHDIVSLCEGEESSRYCFNICKMLSR